jgi:NAD-dependent dihydropyrimidine dehydrogenase PreA subunit
MDHRSVYRGTKTACHAVKGDEFLFWTRHLSFEDFSSSSMAMIVIGNHTLFDSISAARLTSCHHCGACNQECRTMPNAGTNQSHFDSILLSRVTDVQPEQLSLPVRVVLKVLGHTRSIIRAPQHQVAKLTLADALC